MKFADVFPQASEAQWRGLVTDVLKGGDFEKLVSKTHEALRIEPLYPRASESAPRALRQKAGPWRISQRMDHPEPETANRLALTDLKNGADSLTLVVSGAPAGRGFGVEIAAESDFDRALAGDRFDLASPRCRRDNAADRRFPDWLGEAETPDVRRPRHRFRL
jgi:methylmalonyl-CoA mutase